MKKKKKKKKNKGKKENRPREKREIFYALNKKCNPEDTEKTKQHVVCVIQKIDTQFIKELKNDNVNSSPKYKLNDWVIIQESRIYSTFYSLEEAVNMASKKLGVVQLITDWEKEPGIGLRLISFTFEEDGTFIPKIHVLTPEKMATTVEKGLKENFPDIVDIKRGKKIL